MEAFFRLLYTPRITLNFGADYVYNSAFFFHFDLSAGKKRRKGYVQGNEENFQEKHDQVWNQIKFLRRIQEWVGIHVHVDSTDAFLSKKWEARKRPKPPPPPTHTPTHTRASGISWSATKYLKGDTKSDGNYFLGKVWIWEIIIFSPSLIHRPVINFNSWSLINDYAPYKLVFKCHPQNYFCKTYPANQITPPHLYRVTNRQPEFSRVYT